MTSPTSEETNSSHLEGMAAIVFLPDESHFYGRLIVLPPAEDRGPQQFTLEGRPCDPPQSHFHQCCFDGENPQFFTISLEDPKQMDIEARSKLLKFVMRIGGDNATLTSSNVDFHTDQLLVDDKAEAYIEKYFSEQLLDKQCFVCLGEMKIDFQGDGAGQGGLF